MAKKRKLSPIQQYINMENDWSETCLSFVKSKTHILDDREGASGLYTAYKLMDMASKSSNIVRLLSRADVQDALDNIAIENGYPSGQVLLQKSMNWDEVAQSLRDKVFKEFT